MKRLLLIHTGGTLMMRGKKPSPLKPDVYTGDLLKALPILGEIAEIETHILFNLDSSDLGPRHWVELGRLVHENLSKYDGFVIVHGTDTMAYSASALAFLLPNLDRPVLFTGAQTPLADVRTDARTNLVDSCHLATCGVPEVGVVFGSKLFRGCRSSKLDAWGMAAFGSPTCPPLAELGLGVQLGSHVLPPRRPAAYAGRIEPRVLAVRIFPGFEPAFLSSAISHAKGLVIEAFGAGNVPVKEESLIPTIEKASANDVPVVIVSQCPRGGVDLERYEGGAAASKAGAIGAGDMTAEAALTKLMVVLGATDPGDCVTQAREAFGQSWVGEMTQSG